MSYCEGKRKELHTMELMKRETMELMKSDTMELMKRDTMELMKRLKNNDDMVSCPLWHLWYKRIPEKGGISQICRRSL